MVYLIECFRSIVDTCNLGDYNTAYEGLELLLSEICNDQNFIESSIGEILYTDIVMAFPTLMEEKAGIV